MGNSGAIRFDSPGIRHRLGSTCRGLNQVRTIGANETPFLPCRTRDDPQPRKRPERVSTSLSHQEDGPAHDRSAQKVGRWAALQEQIERNGRRGPSDVKDAI